MEDDCDLLDQILEKHKEKLKVKKFDKKKKIKKKIPSYCVREHQGKKWVDESLKEWDRNDYRAWVGNLGQEITENHLMIAFKKYPSFLRAKVVKNNINGKNRGYGFISFKDPDDYLKAMKEMNGKYIGKRPIVLKKSKWKDKILTKN